MSDRIPPGVLSAMASSIGGLISSRMDRVGLQTPSLGCVKTCGKGCSCCCSRCRGRSLPGPSTVSTASPSPSSELLGTRYSFQITLRPLLPLLLLLTDFSGWLVNMTVQSCGCQPVRRVSGCMPDGVQARYGICLSRQTQVCVLHQAETHGCASRDHHCTDP